MKKVVIRLSLALLVFAVLGAGWQLLLLFQARTLAEEAYRHEDWPETRAQLRRYFLLGREDAGARLMLAEALVRDTSLPTEEAVKQAVEHLQHIPDKSPLGPKARIQEARVRFLILREPYRAEKLFRKGIAMLDSEADEARLESLYLLWKLLDMTGRSTWAEPIFWRTYEHTPAEKKLIRLREWYLSQFFPLQACVDLDRTMGFIEQHEYTKAETELLRVMEFHLRDPDSPTGAAVLARWHQGEGKPQRALEVLESVPDPEAAFQEPYYVAVLVSTLFDLGEFVRAERCWERWPGSHEEYYYWKWKAIILDEIDGSYSEALEAYDKAFSIWPGTVDWRNHYRKARCLAKLGKHQEARRARERVEEIQELMSEEAHAGLKLALDDLDNPERLGAFVQYYRRINHSREAECWRKEIDRLRSSRVDSSEREELKKKGE